MLMILGLDSTELCGLGPCAWADSQCCRQFEQSPKDGRDLILGKITARLERDRRRICSSRVDPSTESSIRGR